MYRIYRVKENDTLSSIADKYNTSVEVLRKINGYNNAFEVRTGDFIIVPIKSNDLFAYYTVKKGDTLYKIARENNTTVEDLTKLNGIDKDDYIYPNQEILVPKEEVAFYFTQEGDTLSSAAENLNTNAAELIIQNDTIYLLPEQMIIYKKGGTIDL